MLIEEIARIVHEANRELTAVIKDVPVQPPWDEAPESMRTASAQGIRFRLANPTATPADMHANWMKTRLSDGWVLGAVKGEAKKTHPALVPYEQLPEAVRLKDKLFSAIVDALK